MCCNMNGSTLNNMAFELMMKTFEGRKHRPDERMLAGLRSILKTNTQMLLGEASKSYFLSSLEGNI